MTQTLYYPLDEKQVQQRVASEDAMRALEETLREGLRFNFLWEWCEDGGEKCLAKSTQKGVAVIRPDGKNDLPAILNQHNTSAAQYPDRLKKAQAEVANAIRSNKALSLGTVPHVVVKVLNAMHTYNVMEPYRVIGTHALYAYEAAARVAFDSGQTATQDIDLLWNYHRRLKFGQIAEGQAHGPMSMVEVLQVADPTFKRDEENKESAINADAFAVDFLRTEERPEPELKDRQVMRLSARDDDVLPVVGLNAHKFMQGPIFNQIVICIQTGEMAMMPTVDPVIFSHFKQQMSRSDLREPQKRNRDKTQAEAVVELLNTGLLTTALSEAAMRGFPVDGLKLG